MPPGGTWRRNCNRDLVPKGRACVRQQIDMMGLAKDPRIGNAQPDRIAAGNRPRRFLREGPVCIIHGNLRDHHRFRSAGAHPERYPRPIEDRPFDGQRLDRGGAVVEAAQGIERGDPDKGAQHDGQRHEDEKQTGHWRAAALDMIGHAPASRTSKKPIQPSSVNSAWCAWNIYIPSS